MFLFHHQLLLLFLGFSSLIAFDIITVSSVVFILPLILLLLFECFHLISFLFRDSFLSGTSFLYCCTGSDTDLRGLVHNFLFSSVFTLHSFPTFRTTCFYQGFRPEGSSPEGSSRASRSSSKHKPDPSVYLNHLVFSKRY